MYYGHYISYFLRYKSISLCMGNIMLLLPWLEMGSIALQKSANGVPASCCSVGTRLRDHIHLIVGSAFRNVRYKFVFQIVGCGGLCVGPPALAGCSEGTGRCGMIWGLTKPAIFLASAGDTGEAGVASGGGSLI